MVSEGLLSLYSCPVPDFAPVPTNTSSPVGFLPPPRMLDAACLTVGFFVCVLVVSAVPLRLGLLFACSKSFAYSIAFGSPSHDVPALDLFLIVLCDLS